MGRRCVGAAQAGRRPQRSRRRTTSGCSIRAWACRASFGNHWAVSGSGFRAFRAPTPNELYRSTQVGNQLTYPNGTLLSERATGWETGLATEWRWGTIRVQLLSYPGQPAHHGGYLNPAYSGRAQSLLKRENLGQIESRGVAVDFRACAARWLAVDGGYQYAHATVTRGQSGLWATGFPKWPVTWPRLNLRAYRPSVGNLEHAGTIERTPVRRRRQSISCCMATSGWMPTPRTTSASAFAALCRRREPAQPPD